MITVRIARIERRIPPGPQSIGFPSHVAILADDAGRRALPLWVQGINPRRLEPPAAGGEHAGTAAALTVDQVTARLLHAAGASVTGVDIDEIGPEVAAARIGLATAAGTKLVTARVAEGLAVAIATGAPVRVADPVLDRLAVPLPDNGPVPLPEPAAALAVLSVGRRQRYEPRNLAFADGLDGWLLGGSFTQHASDSHWQDYSSGADDGIAVLSASVPRPAGFAFLGQEMFADDYRGDAVSFRGEFRTRGTAPDRVGLFLRVVSGNDTRLPVTERAAVNDPDNNLVMVSGDGDWTSHQVTARVLEDSNSVIFGVFLAGPGRIEMRNAELARAE